MQNEKPLLIHVGEDYWLVIINWKEHELNFNLIYDLFYTDILELSKEHINFKEFMDFINNI